MIFSFVAEVAALINKHVAKGWHSPIFAESDFEAACQSKVLIATCNKATFCAYYFLNLVYSPTRLSFEMRQAKIQQGVI